MSNRLPELRRSGNVSPEFALLGFLVAGPDHGYDLHQRVVHELGHVWHLSQSQAYAILKRLESRGDISARLVEQQKRPDRQRLRITPQGRRRFLEWLEKGLARNARAIRLEFLTRLYFCNLYMPKESPRIYGAQISEIKRDVERLEHALADVPADQTYNRLSLDLRLRQMKLIEAWMVEIRTRFHIVSEVTA